LTAPGKDGAVGPAAIPRAWVEELAAALAPEPEVIAPVPLRLTHLPSLPDTLASQGTSLVEVAADISAGCVLIRRDGKDGEFYVLHGGRFTVYVNPGQARDSLAPTAVVTSVKPARQLQRREGLLACDVTFYELHDEAECDIAAICVWARQRIAAERTRQAKAMRAAERGLARAPGPIADAGHTGLHAEARQRYTTLLNLFTLLRQRSDIAGGARATGVVAEAVPGAASSLRILLPPDPQPGSPTNRFPDAGPVLVHVPGQERPLRLELQHVLPEDIATEAPRTAIPPGTEVTVEYQPRFSLQRHQRALLKFLAEDIEGDWVSLARLLLRPDALPDLPGRRPPGSFYHGRLNAEQRAAVTGAVTTPHAFFIQGPPGTGKTTVIGEIIRQLAARGERVLLLAPMHVAVDEVLRRVGDMPGVNALRLTWSDQQVHQDLRRFTPDNVAGEFIRRVRRADTSAADRWRQQIAELEAGQRVLAGSVTTRQAADAAAGTAQAARAAARHPAAAAAHTAQAAEQAQEVAAQLSPQAVAADRDAQVAREAIAEAAAAVAQAAERHDAPHQAAAQAKTAASDAARHAESAATSHREAVQAAKRILAAQLTAEHALRAEQAASRAAIAAATAQVEAAEAELNRAVAAHQAARQSVENAQRALAAADDRRTWWTGLTGALGTGELGEARRLHARALVTRQVVESRVAQSRQAAEAAVTARTRATRQAEQAEQRRHDELSRATERSQASRAAEPQRAVLQAEAAASATAAQQAQARAQALADADAHFEAALEAARTDHAHAQSQGEAAAAAAERANRRLADAQAAAAQARWAAAAAAQQHAQATEQAQAAQATADELEQTAQAAARRAGSLLGLDPGALPDDERLQAQLGSRAARVTRLRQYIGLERRWFELTEEAAAAGEDLRKVGEMLVGTANLVCCTTTGFGGKLVDNADFDTLIIDEASRVVDSEFLIGAVKARRWILVGDEKQLPPYVDQVDEHHLHALAALHLTDSPEPAPPPTLEAAVDHLGQLWAEDEELHQFRSASVVQTAEQLRRSPSWDTAFAPAFGQAYRELRGVHADVERELLRAMRAHLVRSLFERCVEASPPGSRQRLVEQRRMVAPLAEVVRQPVYQGNYRSPSPAELAESGVTWLTGKTWDKPLVFFDTSAQRTFRDSQEGTGFVNPLEAEWVESICRTWERDLRAAHVDQLTVSVLTFYRAQARKIRSRLGYPGYPGFGVLKFQVIDAIDRIQGQESDLVILSFCRARPVRRRGQPAELSPNFGLWLQDLRRLNVACTRGRRGLALVGHAPTLKALRGVPAAQEFYRHLFEGFEQGAPGTLFIQHMLPPGRSEEV
jgi:AAA domain